MTTPQQLGRTSITDDDHRYCHDDDAIRLCPICLHADAGSAGLRGELSRLLAQNLETIAQRRAEVFGTSFDHEIAWRRLYDPARIVRDCRHADVRVRIAADRIYHTLKDYFRHRAIGAVERENPEHVSCELVRERVEIARRTRDQLRVVH
jgi:hypothetical protein